MIWGLLHPRPTMTLNQDLEIINGPVADPEDYGTEAGFRITHVGETPVGNLPEYFDAVDNQDGPFTFLRAEHIPNGNGNGLTPRLFANLKAPEYPDLTLREDMSIEGSAHFETSDLPLSTDSRVTAVEGKEVNSVAEYEEIMATDLGRTVRVTIESNDASAPTLELVTHRMYWHINLTHYILGMLFGLLGCGAFWLKPDTRSAWGFMAFCLYVGVFWIFRGVPMEIRIMPERWAFYALQCFLPMATVGFILTFTPLRATVKRPGRILAAAGFFGFALMALDSWLSPNSFDTGSLKYPVFQYWMISLLCLAAVTVPIDFIFRLAKAELSATDRQRAKIIRMATFIGFVPVSIFTLFWASSDAELAGLRVFFELTVLFFPLIIGYAIVRHNLLQINEFALEALLYGSLFAGLGSMYLFITAGASPVVERILPGSSNVAQTFLIAGVSMLAIPVHSRMRTRLAKRFRRDLPDYDSLIEIVDAASTMETTPQEFARITAERISGITKSLQVIVLLRYPGNDSWSVGASTPSPQPLDLSDSCNSLIQVMSDSRREVIRDEIIENIDYGKNRWSILTGLRALNANVVFPMVARGNLVGAISLGDKENYKNYSDEELKSLSRISKQLALALHNIISHQIDDPNTRIVDLYPGYPETIGPYKIDAIIGEGGMSYVYRGESDTGRVAIKVAKRHIQADKHSMARFHREAEVMSKLDHENVAAIVELGWEKTEPYIVMEYFPNGSLDHEMHRDGPIAERTALKYIKEAAEGLQTAKSNGVIHRDIKPKNLFLDNNGSVKIGDFGLAHLDDAMTITATGQIFGTPDYMGPEMFRGEPGTWQSDQFALGVSLYEILTGRRPFKAANVEALIYQYAHSSVPDIRRIRKEISHDTMKIIRQMMAKRPEKRFASYEELIEALERAIR